MKNLFALLTIIFLFSIEGLAQLTPYDSVITNNSGAGITGTVVLDKNKVYLLQGFVYVKNGGRIIIPAGTIILGDKFSQGTLIIERGGRIYAEGTPNEPIVFTSQQPVGLRSRGDWGGIVICGTASNNRPGGNFVVEGNIGSIAGYGDSQFPTANDNDTSGVLKYVRIEFGGIPFTPNNEINGLTLAAVGRGTVIENVMTSYNGDDAFEFFGGTVNAKYLISYKNLDDDIDTDFGYTGKIQFVSIYRDPILADVSNSQAFESDNDGSGTTATPRTSPIISNVTAVGPKRLATDVSGTDYNNLFFYGIHHRRATRHNLFNSVIMGFDEGGIFLDGATVQSDTANFTYKANTFTGMSKLIEPVSYNAWFTSYGNNLLPNPNDVLLKAPFNQSSPVLIPQPGSPLIGSSDFSDPKLNDPFFTTVNYRGAFSPNGNERWDIGWANFDPQGTNYIRNLNIKWTSIINLTTGNGESRSVVIGQADGATDGVDASYGEALLPPPPASGIVDLRLQLPSSTNFVSLDLRSYSLSTNLISYKLVFQPGSPSSTLILNWDPNLLGAGNFTLKDGLGGLAFPDVNMKTVSSQVVTGLSTVTIEVETKFSQVLVVQNGWNLVSFPGFHPNSMSPDTLYRFRDLTANIFKFSGSYLTVTSLLPTEGYWLKHSGVRTYNWNGGVQSGVLYPKLAYAPRNAINVNSGWNLIGAFEYNADVNFLRTMPANNRTGLVYGYVPGGGYNSTTVLTPGNAYWINFSAPAQLFIPGSFAGTLGKDPLDELLSDSWGKIVITDAIGQNYTLYAANSSSNLEIFNLPPVPPVDIFDVRFESQRFVENLYSSEKVISFTGIVYPVKLSIYGINLRLSDNINGSLINTIIKDGETFELTNSNLSKLKVLAEGVIPAVYSLEQNYPNPFNPTTTIEFSLPEDVENVRLTIYNALGEKVAELVNGKMEAGRYRYQWNAGNVATGLYIYELKTNKFSSVKKMMLLK
ncbi:Hypothetical protein IALB_3019 [Ignavibacterium album JCM 16511]|uniref:Secretion system C-terminal sorting domain-containing protein n=1 Tax=Ignavibacterium album (strain DSM 19864 / JCM 16511 / NBRC 101810 / Mat9-16) TaxID=945713 RepID=I0AP15_IGNAJ|nr:T9SS type A sorting domain-containing protein [Ignavibacterium album]AFH50722.1 Hypothetical protein IALB_3019 [Ignavibacterium album JCM 16511]